MAFGVKTANPFDLLGDNESDNGDIKEVIKPTTKAKEVPVTTGAANVEARLKGNANGPSAPAAGRGRGEGRGGRGGRGGRSSDRPHREEGDGGEANYGERRPGRGRGGARHFERDRKHQDRHDGTGRGHEVEKRHGAGAGNWGAVIEQEAATVEEVENEEKAAVEEAQADPVAAPEEPVEPTEPEKEEMTLDEYQKLLEEKRANLNKKASGTEVKVDTKAFEGMKAVSKKGGAATNELELSEASKKAAGNRKQGLVEKNRKEKEVVPTGFRIGGQEPSRGRGRSGDRGGRRGGFEDRGERPPRRSEGGSENGPRGRGRGPFPSRGGERPYRGRGGRDGAPAINDNNAFPTLGGGN